MFFPYSGLENYIEQNISCMKEAIVQRGGLSNTRLLVYQATSIREGLLYEIVYQDKKCHNRVISNITATFNSNDQQNNIVQMESMFRKIKSVAPAYSYSMIIGSHGNAWIQAGNILMSKALKSFGSGSSTFQIDNSSIVEALQRSGIRLKYLLFDACYMASIEAAYDFRNICSYYIASQNEILNYGVPYDHVGDALLTHNYKDVIDAYYEFYKNYTLSGESCPYGSLSLISTGNLESLAAIVKEANRRAIQGSVKPKVQFMDGADPHIFFDFKDYYHNYCADPSMIEALDAALSTIVIYERHTDDFFTAFSQPYHYPATHSCGINISEPTLSNSAVELLKQTEWWKTTH